MYINPFLAGVFTTIGVEFVALFVWAIILAVRGRKHRGN